MAEGGESAAAGEETGLKKQLQKLVKVILEEDDYGIEITEEATRILSRLAALKLKKPVALGRDDTGLAEKFKGLGLDDAVILSSGQDMITEADQNHLNSLLNKMYSRFLSDQKDAAKQLRCLIETTPSYRDAFCKLTGAVSILVRPLAGAERMVDTEPELQEDLITTVLILSIPENNKKLVAESPLVLPVLIEATKYGTIETRRKAAAAFFTLSELDSNKVLIGNSDALLPLLNLLREGPPLAMKDAASAIFNLCFVTDNIEMLTELGAVKLILQKIYDGILVDELLGILALLSTDHMAIRELEDEDTVKSILEMIRDCNSEYTKENCVTILYNVCRRNLSLLAVIWREETKEHTLAELAETGTAGAKGKASGILGRIMRAFPPKFPSNLRK
ncbi:hypothetical protein PTKIN_Ptkin06aG0168500 [Pterospermum kingtungense]